MHRPSALAAAAQFGNSGTANLSLSGSKSTFPLLQAVQNHHVTTYLMKSSRAVGQTAANHNHVDAVDVTLPMQSGA